MALVKWKQISPYFSGSGNFTGSLNISGSISVNGIPIASPDFIIQGQDQTILTGSFSGSFTGDGSGLTGIQIYTLANPIVDGDGINNFNYDGSSTATISIQTSGSSLVTNSNGIAIASQGVKTENIADNAVTAEKLDDLFTNNGGVVGTFGSTTQIPVITVDQQGRLTSASIASISTTLNISGDIGTDTVELGIDTLNFTGGNAVSIEVTDNNVTVKGTSGLISSSAQGSTQGTISLNNSDVNVNGLSVNSSPTFSNLTITGNLLVSGDAIEAHVTNLNIQDKYILLNSGSTTGDSGIIFGGGNGTANNGPALIWDSSYNSDDGRLSITGNLSATASIDSTPSYSIAGVIEGTEADASNVKADHPGNIRIDAAGDIFIYS